MIVRDYSTLKRFLSLISKEAKTFIHRFKTYS